MLYAFLVSIVVIFFFVGLFSSEETQTRGIRSDDWDLLEVAVIKPQQVAPVQTVTKTVKTQHPLYEECVAALVGLGTKKSEAVRDTKRILESNDIQSLEQFIKVAFAR